jgi:hypothetical protein
VERLARADRRIAATIDQWDADPWLLNTPAGTVNLQTGRMRPHCAEDNMTKVTAVAPEGDCPLFLAFLARIMGDPRLSQTSNLPMPLRFFVPQTIRETFLRLPRDSVPAAVMRSPSRRSRASLLEPERHRLDRVII